MERQMKCCDMFFGWSPPPEQAREVPASGSQAFEAYRAETL
jgi:hypothetical protein